MTHKKIHPPPGSIARLTHPVARAGHHQKLKILVRLDERIDYLIGRGRVNVRVEFAHGKEQLALQSVGCIFNQCGNECGGIFGGGP